MKGLYVAVKYDKASQNKIKDILKLVDNPIKLDEAHTTLIYSKKYANVLTYGEVSYKAIISDYKIWSPRYSEGKYLVAILKSPELTLRHRHLMSTHKLQYDFPSYIPHITLSENIPEDFDLSKLPTGIELITQNEYQEELQ